MCCPTAIATVPIPWRQQRKQQTPSKVALFVEPSPFSHVSGMKNRFESLIKGLRAEGDQVVVVTPDKNPPPEYRGAKVCWCSACTCLCTPPTD